MSNAEALKLKDNDPNVKQAMASDPRESVWVGASAGTGKTKVLTDRVLRLMLPRKNESAESATSPHKILCLTFTKTAAAEMSSRIYKRLSEWSVMNDADLLLNLEKLAGYKVDEIFMGEARKLFAKVLDTPGGLKIMTIHSFCQSILKRFPIEAGLSPHFELVDESEAIEYLTKCLHDIIREAKVNPDSKLSSAFRELTLHLDEETMSELMQQIMSKRSKLIEIINHHGDSLIPNLYKDLRLSENDSEASLISLLDKKNIRKVIEPLLSGTKTDIDRALKIQDWCDGKLSFAEYKHVYIQKSKNELYAKLVNKEVNNKYPEVEPLLYREGEKILALTEKLIALRQAKLNEYMLILASTMIGRYEGYKAKHDKLDYDDLIIKTSQLLSSRTMTQWVLYKLDSGIDHILVDEAQDTSPSQWQIVKSLSEEFFQKFSSRSDITRTLFVVGDDKQSIFSFQGADADEFQRMRDFLGDRVNQVDMNFSFRSTAAVLNTVDEVFDTEHLVFRGGQAGLVELWPVIEADEIEESKIWQLPSNVINANNPKEKMANKIAFVIKEWLSKGEMLKARNRPIKPSDIMILVQSRGEFVQLLMRALKTANIPVAGFDRLKLLDEIAIVDILSLAKFALLQKDDLNLAALLKTPLINVSEDELYDLCYNRSKSLWFEVRAKRPVIAEYLQQWVEKVNRLTPYEFFSDILFSPCAADNVSGRKAFLSRLGYDIEDSFDEFLNLCLHYEQSHVPSVQGFISWFEKTTSEIKREQENGELDVVRIMTVHASKGLQSPIVILPDCTRKWSDNNKAKASLIWPDNVENVPLWAVRKDFQSEIFKEKSEKENIKSEKEYLRLLYVAMTRAEDRLYIGGWKGKGEVKSDCWYSLIKDKFPADAIEENKILRFEKEQTAELKKDTKSGKDTYIAEPIPKWAFVKAGAEPVPSKPLSPSKLDDDEMSINSPLSKGEEWKFSRGNIVHKLLELLPDIDEAKRENAIERYLARESLAIDKKSQAKLKNEILTVLNTPDFSDIFGRNSQAEVDICGVIGSKVIAGTIDRLVVTESEVIIVDFKSNRESPDDESKIPVIYLKQLGAYISLIRKIYPNKQVKSALLWTEKPILMPVSNNILDQYII